MKRNIFIVLIMVATILFGSIVSVNALSFDDYVYKVEGNNHDGNLLPDDLNIPEDYLENYEFIPGFLAINLEEKDVEKLINSKIWIKSKLMKFNSEINSDDETESFTITNIKLDDDISLKVYVDREVVENRLLLMTFVGDDLVMKGYYLGIDDDGDHIMYLESFYDENREEEYTSVFGTEYTEFINTVFIENIKRPEKLEMIVDDEYEPTFKVEPKDATHTDILLSSSDEEVASIDNGVIKALKKGECIVSGIVEKDGYSFEIPVTVNNPPLKKVTISNFETLIREGGMELTFEYYPENADIDEIEWKSSNDKVLDISPEGIAKGISVGKTTLTLTVNGKVKDSIKIAVLPIEVSGVDLKDEKIQVKYGETYNSVITIVPSNADDQSVKWITADKKIATVDKTGLITAVDIGETEITAICNGIEDKMIVEVLPPDLETITLDCEGWNKDKEAYVVEVGGTLNTKIRIDPKNADVSGIKYNSSNSKIVSIDSDGVITAKMKGYATITASCNGVISNEIEVYAMSQDSLAMLIKYGDEDYYEELVYVSASGKKYHRRPGCSNMKNPQEVTIEEAERRGKTRCKRCY